MNVISKIKELLEGKNFDDLVEIYEGFTKQHYNLEIETEIMAAMDKADAKRFIAWAEEY